MLGLLAAFQFLTVLPIKRGFTSAQIGRATVYFPLVGIFVGLVMAGVNYLLGWILPSAVVNILLVALLALLSGGLHLDGVADTMDGIAGHRTAEQRLEIMRDSRIGGFGAIGLGLILLIEYVSLNSVPDNLKWYILILAPALSRWAMVSAIFVYPYARPSGLGRAFKDAVSWQQLAIATLISILLSIFLLRTAGIVIMAGCWVIITGFAIYLKRQLNGLTGDTYGAINEVAMVSVFLLAILLNFNHWFI
jgi:adenosylcobinamide-GDP ribazoletransferase